MGELGGADLSGIGWGIGIDRTILAAESEEVVPTDLSSPDLFIIPLGDSPDIKSEALKIASTLRSLGKVVDISFGDRALKGAMKSADKARARFVIVLGDKEITSGQVELKTMSTGDTKSIRIGDLKSFI
jgi:histidyl-tRNA synthetase